MFAEKPAGELKEKFEGGADVMGVPDIGVDVMSSIRVMASPAGILC